VVEVGGRVVAVAGCHVIAGHDEAPPLHVAEVEVEHVELVDREQIDDPFDVFDGEPSAYDIEGEASPREVRAVGDLERGELTLRRQGGHGQQPTEERLVSCSGNEHPSPSACTR
jgi:hypothetical protein